MRKRKLYLSELIKRNKNKELQLTIIFADMTLNLESVFDMNAIPFFDCEVKKWKVIKTINGYKLIVSI